MREQRLPGLRPEALLGRRATQEALESGVGAADRAPSALEIDVAAGNDEQIDGLVERIPIGEGKLEHRFGPRQRLGGGRRISRRRRAVDSAGGRQ